MNATLVANKPVAPKTDCVKHENGNSSDDFNKSKPLTVTKPVTSKVDTTNSNTEFDIDVFKASYNLMNYVNYGKKHFDNSNQPSSNLTNFVTIS